MVFKLFVLGLLQASVFGMEFQRYGNQWDGRMNDIQENPNLNFIEYSDVGSDLPADGSFFNRQQNSEGIAESENAIGGNRENDEFNPETMFQDSNEHGECQNFPNQTMIRPHFFSCNSPGQLAILQNSLKSKHRKCHLEMAF